MPILSIPYAVQATRFAAHDRLLTLELDYTDQGSRRQLNDLHLVVGDVASTLADGMFAVTVADFLDPVNRRWTVTFDPRQEGNLAKQVPGINGLVGGARIDLNETVDLGDGFGPVPRFQIVAQSWVSPWKLAVDAGRQTSGDTHGAAYRDTAEAWALARYGAAPEWLGGVLDFADGSSPNLRTPWASPTNAQSGSYSESSPAQSSHDPGGFGTTPTSGNLLIILWGENGGTGAVTAGSGWAVRAELDSNAAVAVLDKVSDGATEATDQVFTTASTGIGGGGWMEVTEMADPGTTTPQTTTRDGGSSTTQTFTAITPNETLSVAFGSTAPSNNFSLSDAGTMTDFGSTRAAATYEFSTGTSSYAPTLTFASSEIVSQLLAVYEPSGGAPPATFTPKVVVY